MARTSKLTKTENTETEVIKNEEVVEEVKTTVVKKKVKQPLDRNEVVVCRSVYDGVLYYENARTGAGWSWDYGDEQEMTLGDLLGMTGGSKMFLNAPWIMVDTDNEEILERLDVKKLYESIALVEDVEELFEQPLNEISRRLDLIPKAHKENLATTVTKLIQDEKLYDTRIIKLLEKKLDKEFKE